MPPKVSVVVATFCPGAGLESLVRSLDLQTLPQADFEVIFVDDGSTDDTWARLEELRARRANVRIERIPHSGWPSRPRNIGTDLAGGDYVFFVDHDDEIYPDGLRAATAFAAEHRLDVTSVKHVQTGNPGYAFDSWTSDLAGDRDEIGLLSLSPMTPHKLYRRAWLLENRIRFVEGGRVMWEDIYFNVDAYAAAGRIGTLGSTCVYRHVLGTGNASHSYQPEREEYWRTVGEVLEHAAGVLAGEEFAAERAKLFQSHYRDRVLRNVVRLSGPEQHTALTAAEPYIDSITRRFAPDPPDQLSVRERRLDDLWRHRDLPALRDLVAVLGRCVGVSHTVDVEWDGAGLAVRCIASWDANGDVAAGTLAARDDGETARIVAERTPARTDLLLLDRSTDETTPVPTTIDAVTVSADDPVRTLSVRSSALLSAPAADGTFDVYARNSGLGFVNTRRLRTALAAHVGLVGGRAVVAYRNKQGMLSLDVGQRTRSVVNSARREYANATITRTRGRVQVSVPLGNVHVAGTTRIAGTAELHAPGRAVSTHPVMLTGDPRGAHLQIDAQVRPGRYEIGLTFAGRTVASPIVLTVPRFGPPSLADGGAG